MNDGKTVLISIRPEWCGKIFTGRKNLEFRKAVPNIQFPFKCYVYCTARRERLLEIIKDGDDVYGTEYHGKPVFIKTPDCTPYWLVDGCKKVIGEMTVDRVAEVTVSEVNGVPFAMYGGVMFSDFPDKYLMGGGVTLDEFKKYKGKGHVYGWHITDYKLYGKPKKIEDFRFYGTDRTVKYPPQSYVFVNDLATLYPSNNE